MITMPTRLSNAPIRNHPTALRFFLTAIPAAMAPQISATTRSATPSTIAS